MEALAVRVGQHGRGQVDLGLFAEGHDADLDPDGQVLQEPVESPLDVGPPAIDVHEGGPFQNDGVFLGFGHEIFHNWRFKRTLQSRVLSLCKIGMAQNRFNRAMLIAQQVLLGGSIGVVGLIFGAEGAGRLGGASCIDSGDVSFVVQMRIDLVLEAVFREDSKPIFAKLAEKERT